MCSTSSSEEVQISDDRIYRYWYHSITMFEKMLEFRLILQS